MFRFYVNCHRWTPTRDEWLNGSRCITRTELERIHQFCFQRDAKFAFAGQLLIRYVLSRAHQRASSSFEIKRTERRRPYVDVVPTFDFNLSHHHQLVCLVATFDGRVGCDTMQYRTHNERKESIESLTKLLRDEFTSHEYDYILKMSSDEARRIRSFYRLWCLKESYIKWSGRGLDSPLSNLDFRIQTDDFDDTNTEHILSDTILRINDASHNQQLRFDEQVIYLPDCEQQIITVCLSSTNPCQPFIELTIQEILDSCTPLDEHPIDDDQWWINFQRKPLK
jgi:4'-phosphopantetheinyl transferase